MDKKLRSLALMLTFTVFATNLTACSSEQIYGEDSFNESSLEYAEGEDVNYDIDDLHSEAAGNLRQEERSVSESLRTELEPLPKAPTAAQEKPKASSMDKKKKKSESL